MSPHPAAELGMNAYKSGVTPDDRLADSPLRACGRPAVPCTRRLRAAAAEKPGVRADPPRLAAEGTTLEPDRGSGCRAPRT